MNELNITGKRKRDCRRKKQVWKKKKSKIVRKLTNNRDGGESSQSVNAN